MTRPTVVVGVGAGGARMLRALADRVEGGTAPDTDGTGGTDTDPERWTEPTVGEADRFAFLALDTDAGDLDSEPPPSATTLRIDPPDGDTGGRPYLAAPPSSVTGGGGLRRRRVLARYYLETGGNLDGLRDELREAVTSRATLADDGGVDVWLLAGLGGGTGGGSLPLLAALVREVAADISTSVSTYVFGGLPALETETGTAALHARNTYVSLRELRGLLPGGSAGDDRDAAGAGTAADAEEAAANGVDYPVRFELPLARESLGRDALALESPPLSGLFLARADPGDRVTAVESAAVTTVLGHALTDGRPGIAFDDSAFGHDPGPPVYAAAAGGVALPLSDLDRLFTVRSDVRAGEDQVADLEERIADLDADVDWLSALLDADLGGGWPEVAGIGDGVFHYPIRRVEDLDPGRLAAGETTVDDHVDSVVSEVGADVPERVPTRSVVALVFGRRLAGRLDGTLDEHPLPAELSTVTREYREALAEHAPAEADRPADPVASWQEAIRPALTAHAAELTEAAADRLNPLASRRLKGEAADCEELVERLDDLAGEYEALRAARETARETARAARERLRDRRDELETEADGKRRERDRVRETLRETRRRRDEIRERLRDPPGGSTGRLLPVRNVPDLIPETLEFADSLAELLDEGFLDVAAVADALGAEIDRLGEAVREAAGDGGVATRLAMLTARPNRWGPAGDLLGLAPEGGTDVPAALERAFDDRIGVDDGRGFAVDLLGMSAPADPTATGLLGTVDERFRDPASDVGDRLADLSDTAITDAIAHPELLPERRDGAAQQEVAEAVASVEEEEGFEQRDRTREVDRTAERHAPDPEKGGTRGEGGTPDEDDGPVKDGPDGDERSDEEDERSDGDERSDEEDGPDDRSGGGPWTNGTGGTEE